MALTLIVKNEPSFDPAVAAMVNDEYKRRQMERKPFELEWRLNIEFVNGNQYVDLDPVTLAIVDVPRVTEYEEREVFNQLATIYETRCARLVRQKPLLKTRPATNDDRDISAAKISSMLLLSSWNDQDMDQKYGLLVPWMELTGTAFLKIMWSPKKGRVIARVMTPRARNEDDRLRREDEIRTEALDEMINYDEQVIREGDVDTCVVSPFEIYPDSSFRNGLEQCRSIIHAKAFHIDEIEDLYGVRVEPEMVDVLTLQQTTTTLGGWGHSTTSFRGAVSRLKNHAVVKEYYERPSRRYPRGRLIVVAGNKTLHIGELPYQIGDYGEVDFPFIRFASIERPGRFWGESVIKRCIPIQRRYNALRNRVAEYLNRVAIGQWLIPEGTLDEDEEITTTPGQLIHYNAIGPLKPEPVAFPALPAEFAREEQVLLAEFTAISGVSELARMSEAPPGVKSGVALAQAAEQDNTRLANTAHNLAVGFVRWGKLCIRLYRQFVKEPRLLRFVGEERDVEVREWTSSDLRSDDVFIENTAALSETPSQRRQMVFDLINLGIFNRPETNPFTPESIQKIFQLLEFGHWEFAAEDMATLQRRRARRENSLLLSGKITGPIPVQDFDDDVLHLEEHDRLRMSAEWEAALASPMGPLLDQIMRQHQQAHLERLQRRQIQQQVQSLLSQQKAFKQAIQQVGSSPQQGS